MDQVSATSRPTLLTVLCILSFLFGIWGLWDGYKNAFTDAPQHELTEVRAEMEKIMAQDQGPGHEVAVKMAESGIDFAERAAANAKPLGYGAMLLSVLGLFGVWQMWNLKRLGFWLYLVAAVVGLVFPLYFLGGGLLAMLGLGFMGFITLVFIVLYAINLKHMR